ncbi:uncharacterized protein ACBT44_015485 [Syngnathus typhle]
MEHYGRVRSENLASTLFSTTVHAGKMALDMKIKALLLETLEDLGQDDFKKFKFYTDLPESVKENADRIDIAEQLTNTHGKNAVAETIEILEKINNYNLAQKLRNDLPQITGDTNDGNSSGLLHLPP